MSVVLDASALLALLFDESGAVVVERALGEDARISAVNLSEVMAKLLEHGLAEREAREAVEGLPIRIVAFDAELAILAAGLRSATRGAGLALGDRACLALGIRENARVLTADRVWASLGLPVDILVVR